MSNNFWSSQNPQNDTNTSNRSLPDPVHTDAVETPEAGAFERWIGKTEIQTDVVTAVAVASLSATLDRDDGEPIAGTALPPLWHWLYFLPRQRQSALGADGHGLRGGFLPPVPLPRRMWAGGRLRWQTANPLRVGDVVERQSRILSVNQKSGRSGDLVFVGVEHSVHNACGLALVEEHDIVYRAAARPGDAVPKPTAADSQAAWQRRIVPDDVLLFRYSALTFNGHRIHYDRRYVTEVEGYPGLVVHGPLIATLLVDLVRRNQPDAIFQSFEFRAVRPTFDLHPFTLMGEPSSDGQHVRLWAVDHEGWITVQATANLV